MIRTGWKYRVRFVDHKTTRDGRPYTTFQVGHKIKSSDPNSQAQYWNVRVTVFDDIPLMDGDEIVLGVIRSVECAEYNGKTYYNMVVEGVQGHQDERTTVPKGQADEDISLPFDLD
mgnify:CR=1 FL=1